MSFKHHQALGTQEQELANEQVLQKHASFVKVYNTNFTFPSTGMNFEYQNLDASVTYVGTPVLHAADFSGSAANLIFDWGQEGPPGITAPLWSVGFSGYLWGFTTPADIVFRFSYSGSMRLYFGGDPSAAPSLKYADWDYTGGGTSIKTVDITCTTGNSAAFLSTGATAFNVHYWNSSKTPHMVGWVKRSGIDSTFRLISSSCVERSYANLLAGQNTTASNYVIDNVERWDIKRDHGQLVSATFDFLITDSTGQMAYNAQTDTFGYVGKGKLVEIYAGYTKSGMQKRFIGNITKAIEASRTPEGTKLTVSCEGILSRALDAINYNYPNQATYTYAGYTTDTHRFTRPNGVARPIAFDQWNIQAATEALLIQADIDPYYLIQNRRYFNTDGTVVVGVDRLLRDPGVSLSRHNYYDFYSSNLNTTTPDYIWQYDFGQDSAYDIIKNFLDKYGYYIKEVEGGSLAGCIELVQISCPISISDTVNTSLSSNYTQGVLKRDAEGYKGVVGYGTSSIVLDWTGCGLDIVMGRGPACDQDVTVSYQATPGGAWSSIYGYYNDGTVVYSDIINTQSPVETFYYSGVNANTGENPCVYQILFRDTTTENIVRSTNYGPHRVRLTRTGTDSTVFLDSIFVYDFGHNPYKRYSTSGNVKTLNVTNEAADIRNDIVVLGALKGSFSFDAEDDDLSEVKNRYITSRVVDVRSTNDPTYKYYVGLNKKLVIEEPTITTQDRADWLALYTLREYRKAATTVQATIPADLGIQLYDTVSVLDAKTGSITHDQQLLITSMSESYNVDTYSMEITGTTREIPPSFRQRQTVSSSDLSTYFGNSPFAFERISIPRIPGKTAYDPMTSEDGMYIALEWTLLVPGIQNIEIWDTYNAASVPGQRAPFYGAGSGDHLVAVPYIGKEPDYLGTFRACWDGCHENAEENTRYEDTVYKTYLKMPAGHGFFARGQNTTLLDQVDVANMLNDMPLAAKVLTFPLYIVGKFQPVDSGYEDVAQTYVFGTKNGMSYIDGTANLGNTEFSIAHFDLEERMPLAWGFADEYIHYPTDWTSYVRTSRNPYDLTARWAESPNYDHMDITGSTYYPSSDASVPLFDCAHPYRFDGTHTTCPYFSLVSVPVTDQTVGIRLFQDRTTNKKRRFRAEKINLIYTVITEITDTASVSTDGITWQNTRGQQYSTGSGSLSKVFNICNVQSNKDGQSIDDFILASQKLKLKSWGFLPTLQDRSSADSIIFEADLSKQSIVNKEFAEVTVRPGNTVGLGVSTVFAVPFKNLGNFTIPDLIFKEGEEYLPVLYRDNRALPNADGRLHAFDLQNFINQYPGHTSVLASSPEFKEKISALASASTVSMDGDTVVVEAYERTVSNAILVSLDVMILDRAGRAYYSLAKVNNGNIMAGKHNEIRVYDPFTIQAAPHMNRYNMYLPTVGYMERNPVFLDTTFAADIYDYARFTKTVITADITNGNLSTAVVNRAISPATGAPIYVTQVGPVVSLLNYKEQNVNNFFSTNMPVLSVADQVDGNTTEMFGGKVAKSNDYVYIASSVPTATTRDSTTVVGPFGLDLWILGGATHAINRAICDTDTTYVSPYPLSGYTPTYQFYPGTSLEQRKFFYDRRPTTSGFGSIDREKLGNFYLMDTYEQAVPDVPSKPMHPIHQYTGLFAYFNRMPVFTTVSKERIFRQVTI